MTGARGLQVAAGVVAVAVVAVAGVVLGLNLAEDDPSTISPPTTTPDLTTTTSAAVTTTSAPEATDDSTEAAAVWPFAETSQRFDDPAAAARSFAVELAGFPEDLVLGDFREGDARSGEVEVRASERGPVTTVAVRQVGEDDTWWVVGAKTENLELDDPGAGELVTSPLAVTGRGRAFEGTIEVELRADNELEPIGATFATAGASEMRPFAARVDFDTPESERGVLMLLSRSAEDGAVTEATVVRVRFRE
ncbi:MAG: Gmad2 immunoglobulin-like domain-containing protein [Acidimicrobiia bacterium]